MEISSGHLSSAEILAKIQEIVQILSSLRIENLIVYYGWGTRLEISQLWQPIRLQTDDLIAFVDKSVQEQLFLPGDSDLIIEDSAQTIRILVCHESDIHVYSDNPNVLQSFHHWSKI